MTIKEISELMNISADTLRYYERIGVIPPIPRNKYGVRTYHTIHIQWIQSIFKLKSSGMTLEKIIEYTRLARSGEETIEARKILLEEERDRMIAKIEDINESLSIISFKLDNYYEEVVPVTKETVDKMENSQDL